LNSQHKVLMLDYRGAPQTVAVIQEAAVQAQTKPVVRMLAEEVSRHLPSKDTVSEALAFYNLVLDRTRYMRDPRSVELVRAPWIVVEQIMAGGVPGLDCDDMTALLCALAAISGAECRAVTVAFRNMFYKGRRQYSHVFAQVREPRTGHWITLDPVAGEKTKEMMNRVVAAKFWPVV
jgi:transglutaminase-like putative cysteine protease